MSLVRVTAIEPVNNYRPGDEFEVGESEARELENMGLVKMALVPRNKMRAEPKNKSAAGEDAPQFASPVGRASHDQTVMPSFTGKRRGRPPGKRSP